MLEFAEFLTTTPSEGAEDWIDELRGVSWNYGDVVDIAYVAALFDYMSRVADGLGVAMDTDRSWDDQSARLSFKDDTGPKVFGKIAPTPKSTAI